MTKTYKIEKLGHTFRNPTYVEKDGMFNADWKETTLTFPFSAIIDKINELIDAVNSEALSDKEEEKCDECDGSGFMLDHDGDYNTPCDSIKHKQSTSLKKDLQSILNEPDYDCPATNRVLKLIQSHLLQKIPSAKIQNIKKGKYGVTQDGSGETYYFPGHAQITGFNEAREIFIKIINNIN